MTRRTIRRINDNDRTTAVFNSWPRDAFVPGWDAKAGAAQQLERVKKRADMGIKRTPTGIGTLKPPF